jgi:mono/diheme cytochrome c family protein
MVAQLGVKDLRSAEFRSRATREGVAQQIRAGSANKLMPAFAGALTEAQIAALAAYVVERIGTSPPPQGRSAEGGSAGSR